MGILFWEKEKKRIEHTIPINNIMKNGKVIKIFVLINPEKHFTSPKKLAVGGVAMFAIIIKKNNLVRFLFVFIVPLFKIKFRELEF